MPQQLKAIAVIGVSSLIFLQGCAARPKVVTTLNTHPKAENQIRIPNVENLNSSEKHSYPLALKANDFLKLVVEQQGIDVVVRLIGPDGKVIQEVDSPNGAQGPEPLSFIVEVGGNYTLEIESLKKTGQPGKYEVKLEAIKSATEQDRTQLEIEQLNAQVEQLRQAREYEQALQLALQAVEKGEKHLEPNNLILAKSFNNLARLYEIQGDFTKVKSFYEKALKIREFVLGIEHPQVADSLEDLAICYVSTHEYQKASILFERAVVINEKVNGPNHPDTAQSLNNLGLHYSGMNDLAKAEPILRRALTIFENTFGLFHPNIFSSLNNLALLYKSQNDYAKAELLFQRALAISEKEFGPNHPNVAISLRNLASCLRPEKAIELNSRALNILEMAFGKYHLSLCTILNSLSSDYFLLNWEDQKVISLLERSLAIKKKIFGPNHPNVCMELNYFATVYLKRGEIEKAELFCQQAIAIQDDGFLLLKNLVQLYLLKGEITKSIYYQAQLNQKIESDLAKNLIGGSENQKALYLKKLAGYLDQTISLHTQAAPQDPAAIHSALSVILCRKGRALDAITSAIETLRRNQTPEVQKLLDDYASLNSQISVLTLRGPEKQKPEDHLAYLKELNTQREQLEADISAQSTEFKAQVTPINLENVQRAIPPNTSLIEYAVYRPFDAKTQKYGVPRFVVYALANEGKIQFADLGEAAPIEAAVDVFRRAVSNQLSSDRSVWSGKRKEAQKEKQNVKELGRKLEALVFAPVRKLLGPTTRVLLSPDGVLNLVPFDALVDDKGKYLVETFEFSYLTSGRDLLRLKTGIKSEQPPLVVANPDYADGNGPKLLGEQFKALDRLPGTLAEAEFLKATFPDSSVFAGDQATEAVLTQARRPEFLHIGTHGYFFPDVKPEPITQAETNRLLHHDDQPVNIEKLRQENPLLRSYLFFAGANHSDGSTENDGILTALEASGLNLWGTKLVVLSACDTGLGDIRNGDGVYGLRRALVLAGSESQMVSLWPVSDEGTRDLMIKYYQLLKAGAGRSQALRQIRLEFLKNPKRKHPYFWASFILSGEWVSLSGNLESEVGESQSSRSPARKSRIKKISLRERTQ